MLQIIFSKTTLKIAALNDLIKLNDLKEFSKISYPSQAPSQIGTTQIVSVHIK